MSWNIVCPVFIGVTKTTLSEGRGGGMRGIAILTKRLKESRWKFAQACSRSTNVWPRL